MIEQGRPAEETGRTHSRNAVGSVSLREALRMHTAEAHARLDEEVGMFADIDAYRRYLRNTHRFRRLVEEGAAEPAGWPSQPVAELVAADMVDLGERVETEVPTSARWTSPAERIGAFYVLEGSAVGARLLFRRAQELGLGESFGARHLSSQKADKGRWPRFIALLDASDDIDHAEATAAARDVFALALSVYSRRDHD